VAASASGSARSIPSRRCQIKCAACARPTAGRRVAPTGSAKRRGPAAAAANQPTLARRLAVAAYRTAPTREARTGVLRLFIKGTPPLATLTGAQSASPRVGSFKRGCSMVGENEIAENASPPSALLLWNPFRMVCGGTPTRSAKRLPGKRRAPTTITYSDGDRPPTIRIRPGLTSRRLHIVIIIQVDHVGLHLATRPLFGASARCECADENQ
jgi:hypothetical protein